MPWGSRLAWLVAAISLWGSGARAQGNSEPSHGRIDGDVGLAAGAGVALAPRSPRAEVELRVRYLESAGLFTTYEEGPLLGLASEPRRVLAAGVELRPLFLFRWLQGLESGHARWDLALDSLGLELGALFSQPAGAAFGSSTGVQLGLGVELPVQASATGLWVGLHGGLRWGDDALASGVADSAVDRAAYLAITLAWHQVISAHVVDVGDRAPQ